MYIVTITFFHIQLHGKRLEKEDIGYTSKRQQPNEDIRFFYNAQVSK